MTVDELLMRARQKIEAGEKSMRAAAEDIAAAQEQGATQRQIAEAIGKSPAWVNGLLRWRSDGYREETPFGLASKAARRRAKRVQSTEQQEEPASPSEQAEAAAARAREAAEAAAAKAKADARKAEADAAKAEAEARSAKEQARTYRAFRRKLDRNLEKIDYRQRDRLVKLLGMLGSHHAGERENAAQLVEQQRVALGLTWYELIIPAAAETKARAA